MDDNGQDPQDATSQTTSSESRRTRVGFPHIREEKKGKGKLIFILMAILALAAVGAWLIFGRGNEEVIVIEPTLTEYKEHVSPTPLPVEIEKDEIKIQILNGSGIGGAAGDLKGEIEDLGYTDITIGNADSQDYETTEVTFSETLPQEVVDEIKSNLEDIYVDVESGTEDVEDYDVIIITGLPRGYSPTPTAAAATATPTQEPTETNTPTPTP